LVQSELSSASESTGVLLKRSAAEPGLTLQSGVPGVLEQQSSRQKTGTNWNQKSVSQLNFAMISFSTNQSTNGVVRNFSIHFRPLSRGLRYSDLFPFLHTVCSSLSCILNQRILPKMSVKDIYYSTRYPDDTGEFEYR